MTKYLPAMLLMATAWIGPLAWSSEADTRLEILMADFWQAELAASPLNATALGESGFDHLLDRLNERALDALASNYGRILDELEGIDKDSLSTANQINRRVFAWLLGNESATMASSWRYMRFTTYSGWHIDLARVVALTRFRNEQSYRDYLARLAQVGRYADENIALMRRGIVTGYVQPCATLTGYAESISGYIAAVPEQSVFFAPFVNPSVKAPALEKQLVGEAKRIIAEFVNPAFTRYHKFFIEEYQPACRDSVGLSQLPGGRELYAHFIRFFTTLDTDADTVHALGLAEVQRIRAEMQAIIDGVEFDGEFADFLQLLRTDPKFYPQDADSYLARAAAIAKRVDGMLPEYFADLPRNTYGISPVPSPIAPKTSTAYYQPGAADGSRAGQYFLNLFDLKSRPLYELTALTLHEAVPGHHLQISIQQELEGMPEFRRHYYFHAYGEGWGLYAEHLGEEMGLYKTPYDQFGRLVYEMWRACRLVVDSGIHAKDWTRQQAIEFMAANTALSIHNITAEVDRYITWPGQALAYKHGELKIKALRRRAERALGERFSLRDFHSRVLATGAVPLTVLDEDIQEWINSFD